MQMNSGPRRADLKTQNQRRVRRLSARKGVEGVMEYS